MTTAAPPLAVHDIVPVDARTPPAWVTSLLDTPERRAMSITDGDLHLEVCAAGPIRHVAVVVPDAIDLDSRAFEQCVIRVYGALRRQLASSPAKHPLRFWNFVPEIHGAGHDGQDLYEVFNAGRYQAFTDWYDRQALTSHMVAASGVGHRGRDFVVHMLAAEQPGRGIENPRQRAAYRYSKRYGPLPPCFARATLAPHPRRGRAERLMVVAGTASIVGEASCHVGHLEHQLDETCRNLEALLTHTLGSTPTPPLHRFRELRAYVVDDRHRERLLTLLTERFPRLDRLEWMMADICRRDLLVEVEGVVTVAGG